MRMSFTQFSTRTRPALIALLALMLFSTLPDSAQAEVPVPVSTEPVTQAVAETVASVPVEAPPVAAPEPAPAPAPEAVPVPASTTSAAVEQQVTNVVTTVAGGGATAQVKAAAEEVTSKATAQVTSVSSAANVQPTVDRVAGSVSAIKRLPNEVVPAVSDPAVSQNPPPADPPNAGLAQRGAAEGGGGMSTTLPGLAPRSDQGPSRAFENAVPLAPRPVPDWIRGLNLRQLFVAPVSPHHQGDGGSLESSSTHPVETGTGAGAAPSEAPQPLQPPGPGPASNLSSGASPGPGSGSFFVPIAALLALLALTAPAISRRWKGALAAPVPSRFVCALERPG